MGMWTRQQPQKALGQDRGQVHLPKLRRVGDAGAGCAGHGGGSMGWRPTPRCAARRFGRLAGWGNRGVPSTSTYAGRVRGGGAGVPASGGGNRPLPLTRESENLRVRGPLRARTLHRPDRGPSRLFKQRGPNVARTPESGQNLGELRWRKPARPLKKSPAGRRGGGMARSDGGVWTVADHGAGSP